MKIIILISVLIVGFVYDCHAHSSNVCCGPTVIQPCGHLIIDLCPLGFVKNYAKDSNNGTTKCYCERNLTPLEQKEREECRCRGFKDACLNSKFGDTSASCGRALTICPDEMRQEICTGDGTNRKFRNFCDKKPPPLSSPETIASCTVNGVEMCESSATIFGMDVTDCKNDVKFLCADGMNSFEIITTFASSFIF